MNTAISIIVDINRQHNCNEKVNIADRHVCDLESVDLLGKSSKCNENFKMGEYLYQNTLSPSKNNFWNNSRISKQGLLHHSKTNVFENKSPPKHSPKRVLSPRNQMSPKKRKKSPSPQKNKILRYFLPSEIPHWKVNEEESGKRNHVHGFSSNNVSGDKCVNLYDSAKRTPRDHYNSAVQSSEKDVVPEVIDISSDGDDDLAVSIVNVERGQVINRIEISNDCENKVVSSDVRHEPSVKGNLKSDTEAHCAQTSSLDMISKEYDSNREDEVSVESSEEEQISYLPLKHQIIDLTCDDDCALDDAGGIIVPEAKQPMTRILNDHDYDDEDDDCVSEISFKGDILSEELRENYDEKGFDKCASGVVSTQPVHKEIIDDVDDDDDDVVVVEVCPTRNRSAEESSLKGRSLDSQPLLSTAPNKCGSNINEIHTVVDDTSLIPKNAKSTETYSLDEDDDSTSLSKCGSSVNEFHSVIDDASLELLENAKYVKTYSLDENDTSDSSLPSPPHIFQDDQKVVKKRSSSRKTKTRKKDAKKRIVSVEHEESGDNLKEILQNNIFSSQGNLNFSLTKCGNYISPGDRPNDQRTGMQCANEECSEEANNNSHCPIVTPSAMQVCQVQAEILLSKLYQPWLDLGSQYVSKCCIIGPSKCSILHGKKRDFPEEADYSDESLVLRMDSGLSAVDLLQSRIDFATYPSPTTVQYVLLCCMDTWEEGVRDALNWLYQLLDEHPPCAFGMLDYYRKILFGPVQNMDASDGTFWSCVSKIEEVMDAIEKENSETKSSSKDNEDSYQFIEEFLQTIGSSSEKGTNEIEFTDKLEHLFGVLDFLISVMEADLNIGYLKHIANLKQYTCKTGRPLIGVALWGMHGTVGTVNPKCRQLFKMYFKIHESFCNKGYPRNFKRLISLMAGVTYASERNSEPPKYPNVESNCKEFASSFAAIMMASGLNMAEVPAVLSCIKPDWFRICVCSKLLEKLYGRIMEISLQPIIQLLTKLCALNNDFPSEEEISNTLLGDSDVKSDTTKDSEMLPQKLLKHAMKKDKKGETRLHIACRCNNVSEVEKLLNVPYINVNEKDHVGWTPLHEAALHGSVECVRKLLNFKTPSGCPAVDLRAKNNAGVTPLMDAVLRNHLKVASDLLQHGGQALLSDVDEKGQSALDFAHTEEMKNVLKSAPDSTKNDLVAIPRTLFIKLVVLTPLAIGFYIKFSEVAKIVGYLKNNTELKRDLTSLVKFQPVAFKKDYLEFKKLHSLIQEYKGNRIMESLALFE